MKLAMVGAALAKLWLTSAQTVTAIGPAHLDDALLIDLGNRVLRGDWLGPYTERALVRGVAYPIWLALNSAAGTPLLLGQQVLYAFACATVALALRPYFSGGRAVLVLYAVLLFNSGSYTSAMLRVIHHSIHPALALFVLGTGVGLYAYKSGSERRVLRVSDAEFRAIALEPDSFHGDWNYTIRSLRDVDM